MNKSYKIKDSASREKLFETREEQLERENKYLKQALKKIMEIIKNC